MAKTPLEVLQEARQLLDAEDYWIQGEMVDGATMAFCLAGACAQVRRLQMEDLALARDERHDGDHYMLLIGHEVIASGIYLPDVDVTGPNFGGYGVLNHVLDLLVSHERVVKRAMEFLEEALPDDWEGDKNPIAYNDYDETSHADVIALFDRAIGIASETESVGV